MKLPATDELLLAEIEIGLRAQFKARGLLPHAPAILRHSMLSVGRLKYLIAALADAPAGGDTAEIGCAAGGTSRLIALLNGGRRHWACDTFTGLVDAGAEDDLDNGAFAGASAMGTRERLADLPQTTVVVGYFPGCAPAAMRAARFAFAHIDVDTYRSILACWDWFASRMLPGGLVALDDVAGRGTRGARQAWAEISARPGCRWAPYSAHDQQVIVRYHG